MMIETSSSYCVVVYSLHKLNSHFVSSFATIAQPSLLVWNNQVVSRNDHNGTNTPLTFRRGWNFDKGSVLLLLIVTFREFIIVVIISLGRWNKFGGFRQGVQDKVLFPGQFAIVKIILPKHGFLDPAPGRQTRVHRGQLFVQIQNSTHQFNARLVERKGRSYVLLLSRRRCCCHCCGGSGSCRQCRKLHLIVGRIGFQKGTLLGRQSMNLELEGRVGFQLSIGTVHFPRKMERRRFTVVFFAVIKRRCRHSLRPFLFFQMRNLRRHGECGFLDKVGHSPGGIFQRDRQSLNVGRNSSQPTGTLVFGNGTRFRRCRHATVEKVHFLLLLQCRVVVVVVVVVAAGASSFGRRRSGFGQFIESTKNMFHRSRSGINQIALGRRRRRRRNAAHDVGFCRVVERVWNSLSWLMMIDVQKNTARLAADVRCFYEWDNGECFGAFSILSETTHSGAQQWRTIEIG
mmetsp:Transcript_20089/g.55485  ORF Transcript_20089/g.55485 Transcript_20089/m.55485 type:complete len:458 (+) Transcript_20089:157-1530(+)